MEAAGPEAAAAVETAVTVSADHVRAALAGSRPSVTGSERARLEAIYSEFLASRCSGLGGSDARAASAKRGGKRATLA